MGKNNEKGITAMKNEYRKYIEKRKKITSVVNILTIIVDIILWIYSTPFWAITLILFTIFSTYWYDKGATSYCIDEYDCPDPKDGFKYMRKMWIVFAIITIVAYYLCKAIMPYLM